MTDGRIASIWQDPGRIAPMGAVQVGHSRS